MSLENIYYIGQTISVVALITSLVFVGVQVRISNQQTRQANKLARAENRRELIGQIATLFETGVAYPENNEAIAKCYIDFENATPNHQVAFAHQQHKTINLLEQALYLFDEGLLDNVTLEGIENVLLVGLAMTGGREYWARSKMSYNERLRTHVDRILEDRGPQMPQMGDVMPFYDPARYATDEKETEKPAEEET